jgi:ParB/RepB/Spo0J family partition protein
MSTAAPAVGTTNTRDASRFDRLNLDQIFINPALNGRSKGYEDDDIVDLARSIETRGGLIQNLTVCETPRESLSKCDNKPYMLIAGFRRSFSLMKLARDNEDPTWTQNVPCSIQSANDMAQIVGVQLTENIQRMDMNAMDIANQIGHILDECKVTQATLAAQLGVDKSYVSNHYKLTKLPNEVQQMLLNNEITFSHARQILRLAPGEDGANHIVAAENAKDMTYGQFEQFVDGLLETSESTGEETTPEAIAEAGTQKPVTSVKTKQITTLFLPRIKAEIEAETDPAKKGALEIYADCLAFVTNGYEAQDTNLALHLKPFMDEIAAKKAETERTKEADNAMKLYVGEFIKAIREKVKPSNYGEGQTIPTSTDAIASVGAKVKEDRDATTGIVNYRKLVKGKDGEPDSVKIIPILIPSTDQFLLDLAKAYADDVAAKREAADKRAKKLAEAEAAGAKTEGEEGAVEEAAAV